jgi:hypothetical protein
VSQSSSGRKGFLARKLPAKWFVIVVLTLVVVMAAVVVTVLLVDRDRDEARRTAAATGAAATSAASPYDLTELSINTDLDVVEDAAFVSIFVPNESGKMTSYAISSELPAAQALMEAIRNSEEIDSDAATTATSVATAGSSAGGDSGDAALTPTIIFVFPSRDTLTFVLDLERGLITRGGQTWRPDGDLKALVETAIAGPEG